MTTLSTLLSITQEELRSLTPMQLYEWQQRALALCVDADVGKAKIDAAIAERYGIRAQAVRESRATSSGEVRFTDDEITIVADITSTVQWDQNTLASIAANMRANGGNPDEFMTVHYSIPESAYSVWPQVLRDQFSSARTLRSQQETFQLLNTTEVTA